MLRQFAIGVRPIHNLHPSLVKHANRKYASIAQKIHIHEVAPRDGIQNEKVVLSIEQKIELIQLLAAGNPDSIEVASFVRPDLVPAMATSGELCLQLRDLEWVHSKRNQGMSFAALVPNVKGLEAFLKARGSEDGSVLNTVVCMVSATESHSMANVKRTIKDALAEIEDVIAGSKSMDLTVDAYVSLAFGCPFEGDVDPWQVAEIAHRFAAAGADKVILADTFGHATPEQIEKVIHTVSSPGSPPHLRMEKFGLHLHNASGHAPENVARGLELGVRRFDCANGGCGGCNFIPNAKGNLATQSLLRVMSNGGFEHPMLQMESEKYIEGAKCFLEESIGRELED